FHARSEAARAPETAVRQTVRTRFLAHSPPCELDMKTYALSHLSDSVLVHGLHTIAARERGITAEFLAYLAEVDERRLYLPAGYPSMYEYCVRELHCSEDAALKRIRAA